MKAPKLFALLPSPPMPSARERLARKPERLQSEHGVNQTQAIRNLNAKQIVHTIALIGSSQAIQITEYELAGLIIKLTTKKERAAIVWLFFVFSPLFPLFGI